MQFRHASKFFFFLNFWCCHKKKLVLLVITSKWSHANRKFWKTKSKRLMNWRKTGLKAKICAESVWIKQQKSFKKHPLVSPLEFPLVTKISPPWWIINWLRQKLDEFSKLTVAVKIIKCRWYNTKSARMLLLRSVLRSRYWRKLSLGIKKRTKGKENKKIYQ